MKTLPLKRQVTPYLATPRKAATSQSEAGIRAESEVKQISHTAANGEMTMDKQFLEKCLSGKPQSGNKMWTTFPYSHSDFIESAVNSEKEIGKVEHPKSSKQSLERNE
ncbi:MAG: hypothetical protein F6K65_32575 [Moorea sp. SIO3C2]|nr:hypothetical protein [Moorena sp. SIO3C2]